MSNNLWRPLDPENIANPYPMYARLRKEHPVYRSQTGEFIVTRYDDVRSILKSPMFRTGNRLDWLTREVKYLQKKEMDFSAIHEAMNSFVLMLNTPEHMRVRNFVAKCWDNREVDEIIQRNINLLLNSFQPGRIDIIKQYAQPLPVLVICNILGIPEKDYKRLTDLGIGVNKALDLYLSVKDLSRINDASRGFINFFREQITELSNHPNEGLFSKIITRNKTEGIGLSERELISIGIFLFVAGEETTAGLIGNSFLYLLKHQEQLTMLMEKPELIDQAIEEVLRYDSVVQLLGRVAHEDYAIEDIVIPSGATVTLVLGSANRDVSRFERANEFDITRKAKGHLAFGTGVHFCMGDWLGKREAQMAVKSFLEKFHPELPGQELQWNNNLAIRRLRSLVLDVSDAGAVL